MSIKTKPLGSLCEIRTGVPVSRAKKLAAGDQAEEARVLMPGAMRGSEIYDPEVTTETVSNVKNEFFTRKDDVIVKASTPYDCAYIDADHVGLLVTSFGIMLRPLDDSPIDMRYLASYLNFARVNGEFQVMSVGETIKLLKRRNIERMEIPVPKPTEQARIAALFENTQRRRALCRALSEKSELLLESELAHLVLNPIS